ncbi:MAG: hypothetical protein ACFCVE_10875 [Phycisphaerae bacterium]
MAKRQEDIARALEQLAAGRSDDDRDDTPDDSPDDSPDDTPAATTPEADDADDAVEGLSQHQARETTPQDAPKPPSDVAAARPVSPDDPARPERPARPQRPAAPDTATASDRPARPSRPAKPPVSSRPVSSKPVSSRPASPAASSAAGRPDRPAAPPGRRLSGVAARHAAAKPKPTGIMGLTNSLNFKQTVIPIGLVMGVLLSVIAVLCFAAGPNSVVRLAGPVLPSGLLVAGLLLLAVGVYFVFDVKRELEAK